VTICGAYKQDDRARNGEKPNDFAVGTLDALVFDHRRKTGKPTGDTTMPTTLAPTSRFASMSAAQVIAEQTRMLTLWVAEDIARRARNAAILAAL
jgi:hypothetical protein